jgi:DNA-binding HxlR family transcriptional regulator
MPKPKFVCPLSGFQMVINGKHKLRILWALRKGPLWFGQLKRETSVFSEVPMVQRVLSRELKALQTYGLLLRAPSKDKVEYSLSESGRSLIPLIGQICDWSLATFDIPPIPQEVGGEDCPV